MLYPALSYTLTFLSPGQLPHGTQRENAKFPLELNTKKQDSFLKELLHSSRTSSLVAILVPAINIPSIESAASEIGLCTRALETTPSDIKAQEVWLLVGGNQRVVDTLAKRTSTVSGGTFQLATGAAMGVAGAVAGLAFL